MTATPWPIALPLALVLDRAFGDPAWLWGRRLPHPVTLMGRMIAALEASLNPPALPFAARRLRGALALALLVATAGAAGALLAWLCATIPGGIVLEVIAIAVLLAQKSLRDHVAAVATGLEAGGISGGRAAVALIVGRDVAALDASGVARAAIESAAENFSDAVVAPAFWYLLLGLPGLLVYKIVNTADSMIGHRSERYAAFGWAAARLDDLLNLIPARLAALLIAAAAAVTGLSAKNAIAVAWRDAASHKSPNAGWPEAATAGALDLALGGPRRYGEIAVDGAWLNRRGSAEAGVADIRSALRLIDRACLVLLVVTAIISLAIAL
jgi:adenosylcobinamide-phosphate synthase